MTYSSYSYSKEEKKLFRKKKGLERLQFLLDKINNQNGSKFPPISQNGNEFLKSFLINGNFISEDLSIEQTGEAVLNSQDNIDFIKILRVVLKDKLDIYPDVKEKLRSLFFETISEKGIYCFSRRTKSECKITDLFYCLGLIDEPGKDPALCSTNQLRVKLHGPGRVLLKNVFPSTDINPPKKTLSETQEIDYQDETNSQQIPQFDYYICHAGEDKKDIARNLTNKLIEMGKNCWYDDIHFRSSKDTVTNLFIEGIELSQFGVPILSKRFFDQRKRNKLCREELKRMEYHIKRNNNFKIVPIWFGVSKKYIDQKHTNKKLSKLPSVNKKTPSEIISELLRMTQ